MSKYKYDIMHLSDVFLKDEIFVPNTDAATVIELLRYLRGKRKDFPKYEEADTLVIGISDDAWSSKKIYQESYCPMNMPCIRRSHA